MSLHQDISASASPETQMQENFDTDEWVATFGKRQPVTSGISWGYVGSTGTGGGITSVRYSGQAFANGTLALATSAVNYMVAPRGGGAPTISTGTSNWEDIVNFGRCYKITTTGTGVSAVEDHRGGAFGIHGREPTRNNWSTGSQAPSASTRTYLQGSNITVPVNKMRAGTMFKWTFDLTKTAAGTGATTIDMCVGTNATTADAARLSFTKPGGSATSDHGVVNVIATLRGPLTTAGVMVGTFWMGHNLQNTGHMLIPFASQNVLTTFDVTATNLVVGLCLTPGSADSVTLQQLTAEALNLG